MMNQMWGHDDGGHGHGRIRQPVDRSRRQVKCLQDVVDDAVLRRVHPFPQRTDDEPRQHPRREQEPAQEMRTGEGFGKEQRGGEAERDLAHDVDADEHQRVAEYLAERRIGEDLAEVVEADEGSHELPEVAQRHVLQAHRDVVEEREPDQRDQVEHRREQEDDEQRRRSMRHRLGERRTGSGRPTRSRAGRRDPRTASWPGWDSPWPRLPSSPGPAAWRRSAIPGSPSGSAWRSPASRDAGRAGSRT